MFPTRHCIDKYNKKDRSPFSLKRYDRPNLPILCLITCYFISWCIHTSPMQGFFILTPHPLRISVAEGFVNTPSPTRNLHSSTKVFAVTPAASHFDTYMYLITTCVKLRRHRKANSSPHFKASLLSTHVSFQSPTNFNTFMEHFEVIIFKKISWRNHLNFKVKFLSRINLPLWGFQKYEITVNTRV